MTNKKLWTGKTVRQELVSAASIRMSLRKCSAHMACESVLDGSKHHVGTLLHAMGEFYESMTAKQEKRLFKEIAKEAQVDQLG